MEDWCLISAGEASGDRYAADLVSALRARSPGLRYFGCAGPQMRNAGVEPVVESESLSVVGLIEVLHHIPRIYSEFRKLVRAARARKPAFAVLTDSPDFHLRLAARLRGQGIPVHYLVAPQVWAWREGRVKGIRRNVTELHCIFPFEEQWFRDRGVNARYIGHPLVRSIRPTTDRFTFFTQQGWTPGSALITLCPGSRSGEARRHLPALGECIQIMRSRINGQFALATPESARGRAEWSFADDFCREFGVQRLEGRTWDAMAHADVTLAASGTVTVEAALLGAPMVTYYKVTPPTWWLGKKLVRVPYYSMVNLIAGESIVPELLQDEMTGVRLAREASALLENVECRSTMRAGLERVKRMLWSGQDPMELAAGRMLAGAGLRDGSREGVR